VLFFVNIILTYQNMAVKLLRMIIVKVTFSVYIIWKQEKYFNLIVK